MIETRIAAALAPLVGDRAYPATLPQDTPYPAITWHRVDSSERREAYGLGGLLDEEAEGQASVWQVVIWAEKYAETMTLMRQAKAALEAIPTMRLVAAQDGYDKDIKKRTEVMEFIAWGDLLEEREPISAENGPISATLEAIRQRLAERLAIPVEHWDKTRRNWPVPGIVLRVTGLANGREPGDGRLGVQANIEAKCLHGQQPLAAEQLAARCMAAIRDSGKWGMGNAVAWPDEPSAQAAAGQPGANGWRVWTVTFGQTVYLGDLEEAGEIPSEVLASFTPQIGTDHEDTYETVT